MARLLKMFLSLCVRRGRLNVETARGERFSVGDGSGPPVAIRFADRSGEYALMLDPALALGELFTDGRLLVTSGTVHDLLELVGRNVQSLTPPGLGRMHQRARKALSWIALRNTASQSRRNVAHHYDLNDHLYALFLDADWQYSCAYFEYPGQSLDDAQHAKKRHIAAKLLVRPGMRVLDVGCGWGGLALHLAKYCSANVTGITLSNEQLGVAKARAAASTRLPNVSFRLDDYRETSGTYDRIVSVGMFEHVGLPQYDAFFRRSSELLTGDGVMVLHAIGRWDGPSAPNPWINKYVFPSGYLPALSEVLPSVERAGLIVTDIEILRLHYADTLSAWRGRFLARRGEAIALFGEPFCRMWEFYLAASETAFRHGGLMVFQLQLAKRLDAVPLTRNYIQENEAELKAVERQRPVLGVAAG